MGDVFELVQANRGRVPVVIDSPHSGECSPPDFGHAISAERLRMTADAYVDELFGHAPESGATFLRALFPRTYIDPNRALDDVDEAMLDRPWPHAITPSPKVKQGIGLVASRDLYGPIYRRNLSVEEIQRRIDDYYRPYHTALAGALDDAWLKFGMFWHLNCLSMRSFAGGRAPGGGGAVDVCIGDRDGECADREFRDLVVDTFRDLGYRVAVNSPYRGVELVQRYSDPGRGRHSIQIELSRALYMDENLVEPHAGFAELQAKLRQLVQTVCQEARNKAGASREAADAAE